MNAFAKISGCKAVSSAMDAVDGADYVMIAVKPQVFDNTVEPLINKLPSSAVILSIAASVSVSRIIHLVHKECPIVRVMPNTPAHVNSGVSAIYFDGKNDMQRAFITSLFKSCGRVIACDEPTLDAIGCISGAGPAFVMMFIESLADAGVKIGIPRPVAYEVAAMTVLGSGKLVLDTGLPPSSLKDQVCSPGGTTIEGVMALEKNGFRSAVEQAVIATYEKTRFLGGGNE
jgi:pyrroline-5-carboxylate reductase